MLGAVRWSAHSEALTAGIEERCFEVRGATSGIPGLAWVPTKPREDGRAVLLGHGGGGDKRSRRNRELGQWFAGSARVPAVAIDGPYHGDRVAQAMPAPVYQSRWAKEGAQVVVDRMIGDWLDCAAALCGVGLLDPQRLAYIGMSMGTRIGLPLAAHRGVDLRCAVLGKFGLTQSPGMHPGLAMVERLRADAPGVTSPVLFHAKIDDELFPLDGQLQLYDLLGSPQKTLQLAPGGHAGTDDVSVAEWCEFVMDRI